MEETFNQRHYEEDAKGFKHSRYVSIPEAQHMNAHKTYNKVNEGAAPLCVSYVVMVEVDFR